MAAKGAVPKYRFAGMARSDGIISAAPQSLFLRIQYR